MRMSTDVALARLRQLLPVDVRRVFTEADFEQSVSRIQTAIGFRLPQDYYRFARIWGAGWINSHLSVHCPSPREETLLSLGLEMLDATRQLRDAFPEELPWPLYPEPGGWFPWARTSLGDMICWVTSENDPDLWHVVSLGLDPPKAIEYHSENALTLLLNLLSRTIDCSIIRAWAFTTSATPTFESYEK